jgi:hypothetical protein
MRTLQPQNTRSHGNHEASLENELPATSTCGRYLGE